MTEITFRDYIERIFSDLQAGMDRRFGIAELRMADMRDMLDERYATQTKAVDAAFAAQQTATATALQSAEKAVQAALASARDAVAKAEVAAEKRFESVNEFRAQLSDQAATFVGRLEADTRFNALSDKFEVAATRNADSISEVELRLTSRLDLMSGARSGANEKAADARLNTGTVLQLLAVIASFAAILFVVVFHK